ncbi:hypothetical protein H4Q26_008295 [Puccinia striiformis f. sp. tritici PST-130]|nr:hypothetical protein H4Q26_008295 [Puccinia striiformis f. sp. tritici PST-130]
MTEIKGQRAGWKSDCHSEDIGARFQSVRADSRIIKHYRAKFMNAVRTSAKLSDQKAVHQVSRSPCWGFRRKKLVWYYQDLLIVEDMLANLICPASIMIKAYHEPLHDCTKTYSSSDDAEAGALLAPTTFTKEKHDQGARDPA